MAASNGRDVRPLIVWDGDDTLWFVEPLYDAARSEAAKYVASLGLDAQAWERLQRQIDVRNVSTMGLSKERFPTSCVQAYVRLTEESGVPIEEHAADELFAISSSVFKNRAPLVPGARETLTTARTFAHLVLLTKGDPAVQEDRIETSGLRGFFEYVVVVPDKTTHVFRRILNRVGVPANCAWSVGNSLPSDINPALEVGMSAIWVDAHVWEHERRQTEALDGHLLTAGSINEAINLIKSRGCREASA